MLIRKITPKDFRFLIVGAIFSATITLLLSWQHLIPSMPLDDFTVFWTPARALYLGHSAYSGAALDEILASIGWDLDKPRLPMYHPPTLLSLISPIGLVDYHSARFFWFVFGLVTIIQSVLLIWAMLGRSISSVNRAIAVGILFVPAMRGVSIGQLTPFLLLPLTTLLYSSATRSWLLWGFSMSILLVKPHTTYLVLCITALSALYSYWWSAIAFSISLSFLLVVLALLLDPALFSEWIHLIQSAPPAQFASASWGTPLRMVFGWEKFYLQFIPTALGLVWGLYFFWKKRNQIDWVADGVLLIIVSLLSFPYGWDYDYGLALPAVLSMFALHSDPARHTLKRFLLPFTVFELVEFYTLAGGYHMWHQIWLGPVLLSWYLFELKCSQSFQSRATLIST